MKSTPLSPQSEDQAAFWAAKLDGGSMDSADRATLEVWLAANPEHRRLLSRYCQFSADLEQQLPLLVSEGAMSVPTECPAPMRSRRLFGYAGVLMAAAAAVAVGLWTLRPSGGEPQNIATSVAERKTLTLQDGTVVELDARTNLRVELDRHERHVRMADGEAFFTVAKDRTRPFVIETPVGSVRVTGTVFDVHADPASPFAVTVVEGSVRVVTCDASGHTSPPYALVAGDQLVAMSSSNPAIHQLAAGELQDALAWRRGEAVFDGTPLAEALARFAHFHGRPITAAAEVAKLRVGGRWRLENVDGFLNDLQSLLPVQVSRDEATGAVNVTLRPTR